MIHHLDSVFNISWRFRIWFLGSYCFIISVKVWDKYYFGGVSICLKIRIRFRFQRIRATAVVIMGSIKQSNQRLRLDPSRSDLIHEYTDQRLSSRLELIADFLPWNYPINLFRERSMIVLSLNRASLFMEKARRFEIGGLVAIGLEALYFCGSVFLFQEVTSSNSFRYKLRAWIGVSLHHFPPSAFQSKKVCFFDSNSIRAGLIGVLSFLGCLLLRLLFVCGEEMSQSGLINQGSGGNNMKKDLKLKIRVPHFDNSALIEGYSKTLIGRCMNPAMQDMKSLLFMLPRIWKLEDRVVGADLGLGRFQFDFDHEEDIGEIMKMEPFHFDHWMLSLVRWEPVVDRRYPFHIKFWVRIMGVPLHFWADETFRSIGSDLGEIQEVDLNNGRVKVVIDGFKPLRFEAAVEFHSGEETLVSLRYERLFGFCRRCHSLCHEQARCPTFGDKGKHRADPLPEDPKPEDKMQSYKGAVSQGLTSGSNSGASNSGEAGLGEAAGGQVAGNRRSAGPQVTNHHSKNGSGYKPKKGRKNPFQAPSHGSTSQLAISTTCINQLKTNMVGHGFSDHEQKMLDAFLGANSGNNAVEPGDSGPIGEGDSFNQEVLASTKTSRKNLFPNAEESMGNGKEGISLGLMQQHDLFSDDLSQLIAQEFPLSDTIMEDQEIVPAVAFEEGEVHVAADRSLEEEGEEESDIMGTDQAEVTEEITEDHVAEEGNKESPQEGEGVDTEQPVRKKVVRNKALLTGVSSRKINLHNVVSPRKRTGNKPAGLPVVKGPHQGEKAPPKH